MTPDKEKTKIKGEGEVKRKRRDLMWLALLALVVLGGLGGGAYWFFFVKEKPSQQLQTAETQQPVAIDKQYTVEDLLSQEPPRKPAPEAPKEAKGADTSETREAVVVADVDTSPSPAAQPKDQSPKEEVPQVVVAELPKEQLGEGEKIVINPKNRPKSEPGLPEVKLDIDLGGLSPSPSGVSAPAGPTVSAGGTFQLEQELKNAYRVEHNLTKAKSIAKKILKQNPSNPTARKYLKIIKAELRAISFEKQGNKEAALKEWQKILQWDPGNPWAKKGVARNQ